MCGRYASTKSAADIGAEFQAVDATGRSALAGPGADYNVAPTKPVLAVVQRHPRDEDGTVHTDRTERSVRVMRWGLVPSWAKDPSVGARMINARAETVAEKPAFRAALARRRCLLPADGWYEWRRGDGRGGTQPYFVTGTDGASLALAGIWEFWRPAGADHGDDPLVTAAVVTTDAVGPLRDIHERMPLVLPPRAWDAWLGPDTGASADRVAALLRPPGPELVAALEPRPVSTLVNNVRNEGPRLVERVEPAPEGRPETLALDLNP